MPWVAWLVAGALAGASTARADDALPPDCAVDPLDAPPVCAPRAPASVPGEGAPWDWPRQVLLIGGSSMQHGFGPALARALRGAGIERVSVRAHYSTGLARPDYFDWNEAAELLAEAAPDLVIGQFGGNDAQHLREPTGRREADWGEPAWAVRYHARLGRLVSAFQAAGTRVVLLGYPHATAPEYAGRVVEINEVAREAAIEAGAAWVSTWDLTSAVDGGPLETWPSPGGPRPLRQADGIHLAPGADAWVAERVADRIVRLFRAEDECRVDDDTPLPRLHRIPDVVWPLPADTDLDSDPPAAAAEGGLTR